MCYTCSCRIRDHLDDVTLPAVTTSQVPVAMPTKKTESKQHQHRQSDQNDSQALALYGRRPLKPLKFSKPAAFKVKGNIKHDHMLSSKQFI